MPSFQAFLNRSGRSPVSWTESTEVDVRRAPASRRAEGASELEQQVSVWPQRKSLLCNGRARDVPEKPLQLLSVAVVDPLLAVQIDPPNVSDGLVVERSVRRALRTVTVHQPQRWLSGAFPGDGSAEDSLVPVLVEGL